jgi:type II secretory pathway pseudopilin PulG
MNTREQIELHTPAHAAEGECGFMLVAVVIMVALVLIALAVAAPVVAKDLRRDKEVETQHRAEQYVRAIRLYYRKNRSYPPSIEALEGTNNVRYLRKRYIDPLTGKDDWRIIHVGQNQTTVKGFFGQPLGGLDTTGGGGGLGSASSLGTGFGGATSPTGGTSSTIGATSGLAAGFQGATIGGSGTSTTTGAGTSGSGTSGTTSSSDSSSGGLGQIMGVGTAKTGTSILNPNGQTTYETWEFLYDPKIEMLYAKSNILGGGVATASSSSIGSSSPSAFGSSTGSGSSTAGSSTTPTTPASPPTSNSPFNSSPF